MNKIILLTLSFLIIPTAFSQRNDDEMARRYNEYWRGHERERDAFQRRLNCTLIGDCPESRLTDSQSLWNALLRDDLQAIDQLIKQGNINPAFKSSKSGQSLFFAVHSVEALDMLLSAGFPINLVSNDKQGPLMLYLSRNQIDFIKAFLSYKPDLEIRDSKGLTAIFYAIIFIKKDNHGLEGLKALIEAGAHVNTVAIGVTPLDLALVFQLNDVVEILRKHGALTSIELAE